MEQRSTFQLGVGFGLWSASSALLLFVLHRTWETRLHTFGKGRGSKYLLAVFLSLLLMLLGALLDFALPTRMTCTAVFALLHVGLTGTMSIVSFKSMVVLVALTKDKLVSEAGTSDSVSVAGRCWRRAKARMAKLIFRDGQRMVPVLIVFSFLWTFACIAATFYIDAPVPIPGEHACDSDFTAEATTLMFALDMAWALAALGSNFLLFKVNQDLNDAATRASRNIATTGLLNVPFTSGATTPTTRASGSARADRDREARRRSGSRKDGTRPRASPTPSPRGSRAGSTRITIASGRPSSPVSHAAASSSSRPSASAPESRRSTLPGGKSIYELANVSLSHGITAVGCSLIIILGSLTWIVAHPFLSGPARGIIIQVFSIVFVFFSVVGLGITHWVIVNRYRHIDEGRIVQKQRALVAGKEFFELARPSSISVVNPTQEKLAIMRDDVEVAHMDFPIEVIRVALAIQDAHLNMIRSTSPADAENFRDEAYRQSAVLGPQGFLRKNLVEIFGRDRARTMVNRAHLCPTAELRVTLDRLERFRARRLKNAERAGAASQANLLTPTPGRTAAESHFANQRAPPGTANGSPGGGIGLAVIPSIMDAAPSSGPAQQTSTASSPRETDGTYLEVTSGNLGAPTFQRISLSGSLLSSDAPDSTFATPPHTPSDPSALAREALREERGASRNGAVSPREDTASPISPGGATSSPPSSPGSPSLHLGGIGGSPGRRRYSTRPSEARERRLDRKKQRSKSRIRPASPESPHRTVERKPRSLLSGRRQAASPRRPKDVKLPNTPGPRLSGEPRVLVEDLDLSETTSVRPRSGHFPNLAADREKRKRGLLLSGGGQQQQAAAAAASPPTPTGRLRMDERDAQARIAAAGLRMSVGSQASVDDVVETRSSIASDNSDSAIAAC